MKKFLALVLAVLMIASTVVTVAAFDDVAADNKYAKAVEELQGYGVVAGKSATEFAPDELVTRWQMALFMARATSGETEDEAWNLGASLFTDCTQYLGAIQYCFTKGIIKGVTATEFAPNANITLRDGVIMAVRALGYEKEDEYVEASAKKYTVTGANYWLPYWQKADEIGMLANLKDLSVTAGLTRAQTAQLIYNMLNSVVYNSGANDYKYTLEEVVFGGKKIVNVENVTGAWIVETPLQAIAEDTIEEDEEFVLVQVNGTEETVLVSFADLEAADVDVENIEEYFGAYIELVNCTVTDEDEYIYDEYEYLAGVETENKLVATNADVVYHKNSDRVRIGTKTHYLGDVENRNTIAVYGVDFTNNVWEEITGEPEEINAELEGKLYDVTFIDTDADGYYEVALVNYYNIDAYKAPKTNGKETCGVMKDAEDVVYSTELTAGDVFAYTYNPFTKTVDVKGVIEVAEGEITAYSDVTKKDANDEYYTVATIEIDGKEFEITFYADDTAFAGYAVVDNVVVGEEENDIEATEMVDVAEFADENVGATVEYYLLNGSIVAFGGTIDEVVSDKYLVVEEFTDFELYDYVVFTAFIDGAKENIKVKKIYTGEIVAGKKVEYADIAELNAIKLSTKMDEDVLFGLYTYTVDEDGFYTLTMTDAELSLADYVTTAGEGYLNFRDWEIPQADTVGSDRANIIRVNSATVIYLANVTTHEVTVITPSSYFMIDLLEATDASFVIDRLGYGNTDEENITGVKFGKASFLYIETDGEYVNTDDYKFVYVQDDITSVSSGSAEKFGLETGEEEERYYQYAVENDSAYLATAKFAAIDEIYVSKTYRDTLTDNKLEAGLYILNGENIVVDHKLVTELKEEAAGARYLEYGNAEIAYDVWEVTDGDIDLYSYNYITVGDNYDKIGKKISKIAFRFFEEDDGDLVVVDKADEKLVEYMEENFAEKAAQVLIIPNTVYGFDNEISFINNTLTGIVIGEVEIEE